MSFRSQLPSITRFTFGTGKVRDKTNREHMAVTRAAMDAGVWFHTSHEYGGGSVFETLRVAFGEDPAHVPRCIFKVDGRSPAALRETVEASRRGTGVERIDVAQVCENPDAASLRPGGALHDTMCELQDAGVVGSYALELFWPFSENLFPVVADGLVDSVIFYYNVLEREISNPLYDVLVETQTPILALRTLGGRLDSFTRLQERAREPLDELYRRSGCATQLEFRMRFPLSMPQVRTTIGATSSREHLNTLLQTVANAQPLPADVVEDLKQLHRVWFADGGLCK